LHRKVKFLLLLIVAGLTQALAQGQLEKVILQETNLARLRHGLSPLSWDAKAAKAASRYARDMLERGYFSHTSPEGTTLTDRMRQEGIIEVTLGENIASYEGYSPATVASMVVDDWMNSPHHREVILQNRFTHVGIGLAISNDKVIVVQDFLSRPFQVDFWKTPSQNTIGLLTYDGASQATVGVFVNDLLVASHEPPTWSGSIPLLPGSKVALGLWNRSKYYLECSLEPPQIDCPSSKIVWRATYRELLKKTVILQIDLPPGEYTLARGASKPVPFQRANGPTVVEAPEDWNAIWIGVEKGINVEYTHRIALDTGR